MKSDPLGTLITWALAARFEDLPGEAVAASKVQLLNTAAAMLAGSAAPGAAEVVRQVRAWGGTPESTLAVHGARLPAPMAALANGVMAHAMDFDDTQVGTGFHGNVSLVPALFAVSETTPTASGRDLILAHVLGLELACRMTLAATNRGAHPWLTTTLFGVFGATLGAGKLMGLDAARLRHALGIVYSAAGGNRQGLLDGALIQRVQPGFTAQAAVAAVAYARQGVTGAHDVFDGRYGLYPSHYGADTAPEALTGALGLEYRMRDIALKPYPCCSYSQEPLEAVLELLSEHRVAADDVTEAVVSVASAHAAGLVDHPYAPRNCAQVEAQFSMQYVVAAALCRGGFGLADLQEGALHDPAVIEYARRVRVVVDAGREGHVELRLGDGRTLARRVARARGHPARPLRPEELLGKLAECARHTAVPWSHAKVDALAAGVAGLEHMPRGADFAALLS